ncbi:hypothetical protein [Halobacillus karajensis]|nr:hypothetical protein [Halobacillus karajensis]
MSFTVREEKVLEKLPTSPLSTCNKVEELNGHLQLQQAVHPIEHQLH